MWEIYIIEGDSNNLLNIIMVNWEALQRKQWVYGLQ